MILKINFFVSIVLKMLLLLLLCGPVAPTGGATVAPGDAPSHCSPKNKIYNKLKRERKKNWENLKIKLNKLLNI